VSLNKEADRTPLHLND